MLARQCRQPPSFISAKIASVATHPSRSRGPSRFGPRTRGSGAWSAILTEVKTDDGLVGYGADPRLAVPRICEWVARFAEFIAAWTRWRRRVWDRLFALTSPRPGRSTDAPQIPRRSRGERTQVDGGDRRHRHRAVGHKGKAAGMPVYRLLGGENRPLATYATGGYSAWGRRIQLMPRSCRGFSISVTARSS